MGRLRKSILIFAALCFYYRAIYGYSSVVNDFAINQYFGGFILFLGCVVFLSLEDSLGSLSTYAEEEGVEKPVTSVFLFGLIDHDMLTCCKVPMTLTCGGYKVHFARLLYYNIHGVLFALAWCGLDSTLAWVMSALTDWETGPRIALNLLFLILANCGLISLHQMAGQFGVAGHDSDVLADDDENEQEETIAPAPYCPPEIEMSGGLSKNNNNNNISNNKDNIDTHQLKYEGNIFDEYKKQQQEGPLVKRIALLISTRPSENRIRSLSNLEKYKRKAKILFTFIFVALFWSGLWDLFSTLPKEQLIDDDDNDDEDDYDKHNTGGDSKSYILLLGIFYVVVSVFYLAMSGELFHFVVTEDDAPEWTAESADSNAVAMWFISHRKHFMGIFPESIIDKPYKCCNRKVRPFRLIDYNLKGMMSVIAWIGCVLIVISLEDQLIYSSVEETTAISCSVYTMWLIVANYIFVYYDAMEKMYGIVGEADRPVVEKWRDDEEVGEDEGERLEQAAALSSTRSDLNARLLFPTMEGQGSLLKSKSVVVPAASV